MKRSLFLVFTMFILGLTVKAQNGLSAVAEINYNSFSHKSLKDLQEQLTRDFDGVTLVVNDDFGANVGYSIGLKMEDLGIQYFLSYNSTGGKVSYSDYSGVIRVTQLLQGYTLGAEYQKRLSKEESKTDFYLGGRAFVNYTTLGLKTYSEIYEYPESDSLDLESFDFGFGIRLNYDIPVWVVKLRLNAGYDVVFGGELKFSEDKDYSLEDNNGKRVKTGWSGFRSGIGVVVPF